MRGRGSSICVTAEWQRALRPDAAQEDDDGHDPPRARKLGDDGRAVARQALEDLRDHPRATLLS